MKISGPSLKTILRRVGMRAAPMYRRTLYRRVFGSPDGQLVLQDLCRQLSPDHSLTVFGSPDASAWYEGRRSAWLLIQQALRASEENVRDVLDDEPPLQQEVA